MRPLHCSDPYGWRELAPVRVVLLLALRHGPADVVLNWAELRLVVVGSRLEDEREVVRIATQVHDVESFEPEIARALHHQLGEELARCGCGRERRLLADDAPL